MSFAELAGLMPVWATLAAAVALVLGCCMGSFINCMAWRIVHGESWTSGRSHCASCGHPLSAGDLVPVASWLALRGRCRYCGERISARYMFTELLCGACFLVVLVAFGFTVQTAALMVLCCLLLGLSLVDLDSMIIPNGYILAGMVLWVLMIAGQAAAGELAAGPEGSLGTLWLGMLGGNALLACIADGLGGALALSALVLLVSLAFGKVAGKEGMGMGDIKLYFVVTRIAQPVLELRGRTGVRACRGQEEAVPLWAVDRGGDAGHAARRADAAERVPGVVWALGASEAPTSSGAYMGLAGPMALTRRRLIAARASPDVGKTREVWHKSATL